MYKPQPPRHPNYTGEIDLGDLPVAAFLVDETRRVVGWNQAAERLLGFSEGYATGRLCNEVFCPDSPRLSELCRSHCSMVRRQVTPNTSRVDLLVRRRDGARKRVLLRTSVTRSGVGAPRILHVLDDLDDLAGPPSQPQDNGRSRQAEEGGAESPLSAREIEVLRMLGSGQSVESIANQLSISQITVRNHITHAMDKLGVSSRLHAVIAAHRLGLI